MQNKYKKQLLIVGIVLFLFLQNLSAQAIKKGSENTGYNEEKSNSFSEIVTLLNNQTSSVQSSSGGEVNSTSFNNTATAGQPGPVGYSTSSSFNNLIGFIPSLTFGVIDITAPTAPQNLTANGTSPSAWTNNEIFQIDWDNPPDNSGISVAYYKLSNAPASNDDTTGSLPQDGGTVTATMDEGQQLYLWLVDGAGNLDYNNHAVVLLQYDATSPVGTIASSPDTSINTSFEVSWSGGNDGSGSGISGNYNVRIKDGTGMWTDWLTNFNGNSDYYQGLHDHTYYFEAAAIDCVGNVEEFVGIAEDTTFVDTTIIDTQAPAAPTNLIAGGSNPSPWQNSTLFQLNWQNPPDMSGVVSAYYKLGSAPGSNFDTTGSISGQPPDNVIANLEGGQNLFLWLVDGVGNLNFNNYSSVELRYDISNPIGTIASSPDESNTESFTVSWSGGSDTGGSGLSGYFDVMVKDGSGNWTSWKVNYNGTSDNYTGVHGHTYYFEAASRDIAGNIEVFAGIAEDSTLVNISGDITAPVAPESLLASPSDWTNVNDFTVSWTNPEPDANIDGAWHKIGAAPTNDDDGFFDANDITDITGINADNAGESNVYVWLQDKSGNHSYLNAAIAIIKFDSIPPVINPNLATTYTVGTPITVLPAFSDLHSGFGNANLFYRKAGATNTVGPVPFVNDSATIPVTYNTQQGVEYAIDATDNANNTTRLPLTGFNSIQIVLAGDGGVQLDNSGQPVARPYGSSVNSYRMFSVPFILNNKTPSSVLEDDLGEYDNTKWRFFDVQNGALREYPQIRSSSIIDPGKGFLFIVNMSGKFIDAGPGRTPNVSNYTQIALNVGWNLIGNPFDFDIPYSNLSVGGNPPEAQYYGPNGWSMGGDLRKWEGLAIHSTGSGTLTIVPQSGPSSEFQLSQRFTDDNWGVKISATGEYSTDIDNYIGVYSEFDESQRNFWHEPPRLPDAISLRIKPGENELYKNSNLENSILSTSIQPINENGNYWDFEIVGDKIGENVRLDLKYFANIPQEFNKYLIDFNFNIVHKLSDDVEYIDFTTDYRKKCEFRILIGNENYIEANSGGLAVVPTKFELRQNFPNPFNPNTHMIFSLPKDEKVTLDVFNLLGQKVRSLLNNADFRTGYHTIEWDGKNDMGENVASGMYVFRLISGTQINMKKGILIR